MPCFYVYIIRCQDNSLYIGSTSQSPVVRLGRHNTSQGSSWVRQHGRGVVVYNEVFPGLLQARQREKQLKGWTRKKKERLIAGLHPTKE